MIGAARQPHEGQKTLPLRVTKLLKRQSVVAHLRKKRLGAHELGNAGAARDLSTPGDLDEARGHVHDAIDDSEGGLQVDELMVGAQAQDQREGRGR